jgi:hypothetical protein
MSSQDARNLQLSWKGKEIWPNGTEDQEQLFVNLEQLHQMAMFITEAGLSICERRRRRRRRSYLQTVVRP